MSRRLVFSLLALCLAVAWPGRASASDGTEAELRELNAAWVRSFEARDVARLRQIIADDFQCVAATGRVVDKETFLQMAAVWPYEQDLRLVAVSVRIYGEAAVVSGTVHYTLGGSGSPPAAMGARYTTTYVRREGVWRMEAAQWTRIPPDAPSR